MRVSDREQPEIGNVASRGPATTKSREAHPTELLPAPGVQPGAAAEPLERPSCIAEHGGERSRAARRALAGSNSDTDLLDSIDLPSQCVHDRGRQGGHGTRAGN